MRAMAKQTFKERELRKPLAILAGWAAIFLVLAAPVLYRRFPLALTAPESHAAGIKSASRSASATKRSLARETASAFWSDSDHDGLPDGAELRSFQDRDSFRRWFTAIAELQFYRLSEQWNPEQRDCAGLVRFAWREALRPHDGLWFRRMGPEYEPVAVDVAEFDLNQNPLGEKLFRTDFGTFKREDVAAGRFAEFADARSLKSFNTTFVSRDRRQAQPGDLLFFYQPWVRKQPYHVMIFLGPAHTAANGAEDWVVYHTGSSPVDNGAVKKVELSILEHHPDPRWRPVESNRNFLGFYRLKILE
ncbi:MAG: uncharacterized protein QOD75_3834 [Blastocatellia bacterium]|jgi:uncharacterized protein YfaT (DUF1175 family)|nr:uncharacterized protein [Blastocatellia bacterium]